MLTGMDTKQFEERSIPTYRRTKGERNIVSHDGQSQKKVMSYLILPITNIPAPPLKFTQLRP